MDRDQSIRVERDLCICFIVREFLLEAKTGKIQTAPRGEEQSAWRDFSVGIKWRITRLFCAS